MSTHVLEFQSFLGFLHHFVLAKIATSNIRVEIYEKNTYLIQAMFDMEEKVVGSETLAGIH